MLNEYLQNFKDNRYSPKIQMLYNLKWTQIEKYCPFENCRILDFGSGFGTTANHLAKENTVYAIEPNTDMVEAREQDHPYTQIVGDYTKLDDFEDESFDLIICHNVLEFAKERAEIVTKFERLLKKGGMLSIVKNNNEGRVLFKAVSNDIDGATDLLNGGHIANTFGKVTIYDHQELTQWGKSLEIVQLLGLQIFFGLQANSDEMNEDKWMTTVLKLEMEMSELEAFKGISLFHHVFLRKK